MKVIIEFECNNAQFHPAEEKPSIDYRLHVLDNAIDWVLHKARGKLGNQFLRTDSLCTHDESDDVLLDISGNRIGTVKLEK